MRFSLQTVAGLLLLGMLSVPSFAQSQSPCSDLQYKDYSVDPPVCRSFEKPAILAEPNIPDRTTTMDDSECTRGQLNAYLEDMGEQGGGTVIMPACTIDIHLPLYIPSNVKLRGQGSTSILRATTDLNGKKILVIKRKHDVVVADLVLNGLGRPQHNIEVRYSSNVVIEGVESKRARDNGMVFHASRLVTLRYNNIHDVGLNGVSSKDCYPKPSENQDLTEADCIDHLDVAAEYDWDRIPGNEMPCNYDTDSDGDVIGNADGDCYGYGARFTQEYMLYSNWFDNIPNAHCMNVHARDGEVAGNKCEGAEDGMKMPDSRDVIVHHNLFFGAKERGLRLYGAIKDLPVTNLTIKNNRFVSNEGVPLSAEGGQNLKIIDNSFEGNCTDTNQAYCEDQEDVIINTYEELFIGGTVSADMYICMDGSDEHNMYVAGNIRPDDPYAASDGDCSGGGLPVELSSFQAMADDDVVNLMWQTESETNNAGFRIESRERFSDGMQEETAWESDGFIQGSGSSVDPQRYHHRVPKPAPGSYLYRLIQIDFDGMETAGGAVEISVIPEDGHHLSAFYPNPSHSTAWSKLMVAADQHVTGRLFDATGRLVKTVLNDHVTAGRIRRLKVEGDRLAGGTYLLFVQGESFSESKAITITR